MQGDNIMYKKKICLICGDEFQPNSSKQKYCKKSVTKICSVCGQPYEGICSPEDKTVCNNITCKQLSGRVNANKKVKICRVCGQEFIPSSPRQADCNKSITKICKCCGKEYTGRCSMNDISVTCSEECKNKYASLQRQESYKKNEKICELCGQTFSPITNTQKICTRDHYRECKVCGKPFLLNTKLNRSDWPVTCSRECADKWRFRDGNPLSKSEVREKSKQTMIEHYGAEYPSQNTDILAKQKATMLERYGVEWFPQSKEYNEKAIATNLERYGTAWPIFNQNIKDKVIATNIERYGADNIMHNPEKVKEYQDKLEMLTGYRSNLQMPETREKIKHHMQETYGVDYYSQTAEFKEKFKQTSLERYGVENPNQSEEIKEKTRQTSLERYGATNYLASEEGKKYAHMRFIEKYHAKSYMSIASNKANFVSDPSKIDEWMKFLDNPEVYLTNCKEKPTYHYLSNVLGVAESTIGYYVNLLNLQHLVKYSLSNVETELSNWIRQMNLNVIQHDRTLIKPNELDITIPELKFAIEYDPTVTHNSSQGDPWGSEPKMPSYHKMKTDRVEEQGWFLFHIFGYEWTHKRPIIESMIRNVLSKNKNVIYARKCVVKEVPAMEAYKFLEDNHRQGGAQSPIRLGLYYNDNLVSLMTFGKMRNSIGTGRENLEKAYELVRFCNILNTSVVGGASRLFKHFIREHQPEAIRSFSDRAHTRGDLYKTLGFTEIRRSDAGYVWVNVATDVAYHRVNAQKQNIKKFLNDDSIDLTQSEKTIMESHGFVRVFDSGTITWEWRAENN